MHRGAETSVHTLVVAGVDADVLPLRRLAGGNTIWSVCCRDRVPNAMIVTAAKGWPI